MEEPAGTPRAASRRHPGGGTVAGRATAVRVPIEARTASGERRRARCLSRTSRAPPQFGRLSNTPFTTGTAEKALGHPA